MEKSFSFKATIWLYGGNGPWHFITLPKTVTQEIQAKKRVHRGWGSLKVTVCIEDQTWDTSIFRDKNRGYILPIKKSVRKALDIGQDDTINIQLTIHAL